MLQQTSLFIMNVSVYLLLGWSVYINYRHGQMYNGGYFCMGMGAYLTAFALRDWGWPFGLAVLASVSLGAGVAYLISLKLANTSGLAILLVSLSPLFIFQVVCNNIKALGGPAGLFPIPQPGYLLPFTIVVMLVIGFLIYRLEHSRLGRAQEVIFEDLDAAACQGVNAYKFSVIFQTVAGALGGLAGAIYAPLIGAIGPGDFGFMLLLNIAVFLYVGGYTTMWGLVIFTPVLWALRVFLPLETASWTMIIYGVILVVTMILRPEGVITKQALRTMGTKARSFQKWGKSIRKSDVRQ